VEWKSSQQEENRRQAAQLSRHIQIRMALKDLLSAISQSKFSRDNKLIK
jgi:hypothetical protein